MEIDKFLAMLMIIYPIFSYGGIAPPQESPESGYTPEEVVKMFSSNNQELLPKKIRRLKQGSFQEKLTKFLLIYEFWDVAKNEVWYQLWDQVKYPPWAQFKDQLWDQVKYQLWDQASNKLRDQVRGQAWYDLWSHNRGEVWYQIREQVRDQVRDQVRNQISNLLPLMFGSADFNPTYKNLHKRLVFAINSVYLVYQMAVLKKVSELEYQSHGAININDFNDNYRLEKSHKIISDFKEKPKNTIDNNYLEVLRELSHVPDPALMLIKWYPLF